MPQVAVVLPAYNPGAHLRSAIESVIAQTFTDWELVVVDDGSREDLSYVEQMDERVRLIRQENRGVSVARNVAIRESTGELIAFLDADDIWMPTKLAAQVATMNADAAIGLCHTHFHVVDEELNKISDGYGENILSYRELLKGCGVLASSVMTRRAQVLAAGAFDPMLLLAQDYDLWLKLAQLSKVARVPTIEALYRRHPGNRSRNYQMSNDIIVTILQKHIWFAQMRGDEAAELAARIGIRTMTYNYSRQAFDRARFSLKKRSPDAVSHFWWAAHHSPLFVLRACLKYVTLRAKR